MPDISMCKGTNCPMAATCYRHTATPNEYRQSYFMNPPIAEGACEYYWKTDPKSERIAQSVEMTIISCDDCGTLDDVDQTFCPYMSDVHAKDVEADLCPKCYGLRCDEI